MNFTLALEGVANSLVMRASSAVKSVGKLLLVWLVPIVVSSVFMDEAMVVVQTIIIRYNVG